MDVVVCVKAVPTVEEKVEINSGGKDIKREDLDFGINEWDSYALEEAVQMKERDGGTVTVVTVGSNKQEMERLLRECFARGADEAMMVFEESLGFADGAVTARVLQRAIEEKAPDLVLTGVQTSDDGAAQVGGTLAELMGIPHVSAVTELEVDGREATAEQELEGGVFRLVRIGMPALLTIQTGINSPRYPSLLKIRAAMRKDIRDLSLSDLGITSDDLESWTRTRIRRVFFPEAATEVEMIAGSDEEVAGRLAEIVARRVF